jgi:hypothetical protein
MTELTRAARRRVLMAVYTLTCQHCDSKIMNFGGVHFTEVGAVCERSPDTQHRPPGVTVPPPRTTPIVVDISGFRRRVRRVHEALDGLAAAMRPPGQRTADHTAPLPASVVARGADTDAYHGAGGSKAIRRGHRP